MAFSVELGQRSLHENIQRMCSEENIYLDLEEMSYVGSRGQFIARSRSIVMVMNRWAGYVD